MSNALRRAVRVFLVFLPMAAVGTISHELGHIVVAAALGYAPVLHYGSMQYALGSFVPERDEMLVALGGPVSTVAVGTLGFLWLLRLRADAPADAPLGARGWIATLLALFWSREVFNPATGLATGMWGGDEFSLAEAWGVSPWVTVGIPFAAGLLVCVYVVARLHPANDRLLLGLVGPVGAVAGFAIWYGAIGPFLLP